MKQFDMREWFETRLLFPFLPLGVDVILRYLVLKSLQWWQIPDLKTLSITTCFFCLLIAMDLKGAGSIPSDVEYRNLLSRIRKRFIIQGQFSALIFGAAAAVDVADQYHKDGALAPLVFPSLVSLVSLMLVISILDAVIANLRYKLSYND